MTTLDRKASGPEHPIRVGLLIPVILAGLFIIYHPVHAMMTRTNPPVSCQLFGGRWSLWNG